MYVLLQKINYHSDRYGKNVTVLAGTRSDGATGAIDISGPILADCAGQTVQTSKSWWVHDELCVKGAWDDGTPCTNWQASTVLSDILKDEGRWARARYWFVMTYLFGGGKARRNG